MHTTEMGSPVCMSGPSTTRRLPEHLGQGSAPGGAFGSSSSNSGIPVFLAQATMPAIASSGVASRTAAVVIPPARIPQHATVARQIDSGTYPRIKKEGVLGNNDLVRIVTLLRCSDCASGRGWFERVPLAPGPPPEPDEVELAQDPEAGFVVLAMRSAPYVKAGTMLAAEAGDDSLLKPGREPGEDSHVSHFQSRPVTFRRRLSSSGLK